MAKTSAELSTNIYPYTYVSFYHRSRFGIKENLIIPDIRRKCRQGQPFNWFLSCSTLQKATVFNPLKFDS